MTRWPILSFFLFFVLVACNSPQRGLFAKKTPHEQYADRIRDAGLQRTQLGALWMAAAEKGLAQPLKIVLPYEEAGFFPAEQPRAAGFIFSAKRGEQLTVAISSVPTTDVLLFAELWQPNAAGTKPKLLATADTNTNTLKYDVGNEGSFLLRIQPELLRSVEYRLVVTVGPSLAFPVRSADKPRVISLWGTERDAGARSHEGIDIAAKFRTPVVAAADGYISSVSENQLGGKVVFLRMSDQSYSLYYAHLDSQIVKQGQEVKSGEILGLMGNTGNAKTTVPHLHFGIYAGMGGAIDPFPFVNQNRDLPQQPGLPIEDLNKYLRTTGSSTIFDRPVAGSTALSKPPNGTALLTTAVTGKWFKVQLPNGSEGFIAGTQTSKLPLTTIKLGHTQKLLSAPDSTSAGKLILAAGTSVTVRGLFNDYYFVKHENIDGWLSK
ncbi:MAG: M23 family metallopeptidase [Chitinophagaceae bacterium]|nr:M23 family metallopeptidase [Chitinophagaceae bacterium]